LLGRVGVAFIERRLSLLILSIIFLISQYQRLQVENEISRPFGYKNIVNIKD
jgi:hypothetical protein